MSRPSLNLDPNKILATIVECEGGGPLANRSVLFNVVAAKMDVSVATIINYSKKYNLLTNIKTPLGKKGRVAGQLTDEQKQVMQEARANKQVSLTDKEAFNAVRKNYKSSPKMLKLINKMEGGSAKACIKAKCIDCSGGPDEDDKLPVTEIKLCPCNDCPLWTLRPYQ